MKRPRVAVIIPLYNHQRYIGEAIASVLEQTQLPDRLIVVDDGSTDGSLAAAEQALARAGTLAVELRRQTNRGTARTLNETIRSLDEEVIGILNSDDVWAPNRLERLLPELGSEGPGLVFSGVDFFGDPNQEDLSLYPVAMAGSFAIGACLPSVGFTLLLRNIAVSTGNFLFTRTLHACVGGFDESLPACHDWQFLLDTLPIAEPVMVADALYRYRIHSSNTYQQHGDSSGQDMLLLFQSLMAWATAPSTNPLAPTPCNFPRLMPFFVPIWVRMINPLCHNIPRHLLQVAVDWREQAMAAPASLEREAIAALMARIRSLNPHLLEAPPPLEQARIVASERWQRVARTRDARHAQQPPRQSGLASAVRFAWADAAVSVAARDPQVLAEIASFTGLEAIQDDIKLGRAEINLLHEQEVYVHDHHRRFNTAEDRLIWVALTVGELLARHAGCPLLHAAAIEIDGRAALICGRPYAGKSTITLRAMARGLAVLGDDQVRVLEGESCVQALPRPIKLRVDSDAPCPEGVSEHSRPLRGRLDDETTLLLRRGEAIDPGAARSIAAIFHLSRWDQPWCKLTPMQGQDLRDRLRLQLRGPVHTDRKAFEGSCKGLLAVPHFALLVGPGQTDVALDALIQTCRTQVVG